jgi:tripartite-type tricarboxylate transporter receptor subunit TctC
MSRSTMPGAMRRLAVFIIGGLIASGVPAAWADEYPSKPIRIVVPTAPGGLADLSARVFGQKLTERTKTPVIVDNRPGAGGIIGAEFVAKAPPDGYTLAIGAQQTMAILPNLDTKLPYDPVKDFTPVAQMVSAPLILIVHPSVPADSVKGLVALAKSKPGSLTYSSAGIGSMGQLSGEEFKLFAGIDVVHVPYKGVAPATQDLLAGQINMTFDLVPNVTQFVRDGRVRALAVTVPQRVAALPEVPTMVEAGLPDVQASNWFALFAPAGTPREIVLWLNREANEIYSLPDVRERFEKQSVGLPHGTPEDLGAYAAKERARWHDVITRAGIKLE